MSIEAIKELADFLYIIPDPRRDHGKKHELVDIILITVLGVIADCDDWEDIEDWAEDNEDWLRTFLDLPNGIPSHDTLSRVSGLLKPIVIQDCFNAWLSRMGATNEGKVIAIDGKTLRGSYDKGKEQEALHLVNVWNVDDHLILGQEAVDSKSNEITAIPLVLEKINIKGATITIDAMGCQRNIAAKIKENEGDYILALKGNHPTLEQDVGELLKEKIQSGKCDSYQTVEKGHGRIETRLCYVTSDISTLEAEKDWKGITSVAMIESTREIGEKISVEQRYYISSRRAVASEIATDIRKHWSIENTLHWSLDVSFNEDLSRLRQPYEAQNFSYLKKLVISLLKNEPTPKKSMKKKRHRAGRSNDFLLQILTANVNTKC